MGANITNSPDGRKAPIPFPSAAMEDTEAELWLKAHDRLVKASHALDRALLLCQIQQYRVNFDTPVMREFRAAVMEVKALEAMHGRRG